MSLNLCLQRTGGGISGTLREVTVSVRQKSECSKLIGPVFNPKRNLCAGDLKGGKDACQVTVVMQFPSQCFYFKVNKKTKVNNYGNTIFCIHLETPVITNPLFMGQKELF